MDTEKSKKDFEEYFADIRGDNEIITDKYIKKISKKLVERQFMTLDYFKSLTGDGLNSLLLDRLKVKYGFYCLLIDSAPGNQDDAMDVNEEKQDGKRQDVILIEETEVTPSRVNPVPREAKKRRFVCKYRVPNEIVGYVLEYLSSKDDFISFMTCSVSVFKFIMYENSRCAQNIKFELVRTPYNLFKEKPYVFMMKIDMRCPYERRKKVLKSKRRFFRFNIEILLFFVNLKVLKVYGTKIITDEILSYKKLEKLEKLCLTSCPNVAGSCFKKFANLRCLKITGNHKLKDEVIEGLVTLEELRLVNCKLITGDCFAKFPKLRILKLKNQKRVNLEKIRSITGNLEMLMIVNCFKRTSRVRVQAFTGIQYLAPITNSLDLDSLKPFCVEKKIRYLFWNEKVVFEYSSENDWTNAPVVHSWEKFKPRK